MEPEGRPAAARPRRDVARNSVAVVAALVGAAMTERRRPPGKTGPVDVSSESGLSFCRVSGGAAGRRMTSPSLLSVEHHLMQHSCWLHASGSHG